MIESIDNNNFIFVPSFIPKDEAINLGKEFEIFCNRNNINGDDHVKESSSFRNYIPFVQLMCKNIDFISEILKEPVLPTYCHSRIYRKNSSLSKHSDRPSCEISVTLNLGKDDDWNFCIENPDKKECCFNLSPGDAIIYKGFEASHYRQGNYKGEKYIQLFMHYIRVWGKYSQYVFDELYLEENHQRHIEDIYNSIDSRQTLNYF